jgi:hypothetical protein
MGQQQQRGEPCGRNTHEGPCPGTRATVYVYDDNGNVISQASFPCDTCGM